MKKTTSKASAKASAGKIYEGAVSRSQILEELKLYALNGIEYLDDYIDAIRAELATIAGYPKSTTLSQMQTDQVPGASTFYTYAYRLRKFVLADDWDAVSAATTTSITSAARPRKVANSVANTLAALKRHHVNRELTDTDYQFIGSILGRQSSKS